MTVTITKAQAQAIRTIMNIAIENSCGCNRGNCPANRHRADCWVNMYRSDYDKVERFLAQAAKQVLEKGLTREYSKLVKGMKS